MKPLSEAYMTNKVTGFEAIAIEALCPATKSIYYIM